MPELTEAQRAVAQHPHIETAVAQLDAVRQAFERTLSSFYGAHPADFDQAARDLEQAADNLRRGITVEVVRAGEPDARALILAHLSEGRARVDYQDLYREMARRDPRLRDRAGPSRSFPDVDPTLPANSATGESAKPIAAALGELQDEGLVESVKPGGGYTRYYRLTKKAKEATHV